uniref:Uncharacterized protein n=1 Tax=Rhipicephalus zambeziensis TaxID=60191 RepID=A0A224Y6K5_9ACAR
MAKMISLLVCRVKAAHGEHKLTCTCAVTILQAVSCPPFLNQPISGHRKWCYGDISKSDSLRIRPHFCISLNVQSDCPPHPGQ